MSAPNFDLSGRVALITGAGRGIGLGMAKALAAHGAAIALQDIDEAVARAEADRLVSAGHKAIALGGDVADTAAHKAWIDAAVDRLGGLHILINNAAVQKSQRWTAETPESLIHIYRANIIAPVALCQLAVPIFKQQKWGRIVNLGSIQGRSGNSSMLPYAMSKAAIENMTRGLSRDLCKEGITVNCIAPGYFNTWRNRDDFKTPEDKAKAGKWVPMGRIGEPQDAAGLAVLLCSEAGSYITGQVIHLDGGTSAR